MNGAHGGDCGGRWRCMAGWGLVVAGQRRGYYREPMEDALLMRLDLIRGE
jgi:hypothetical protein